MNFPQLKIGHMLPKVPIMQGGMGDGDCENGLVFAGSRVHEIKEILPVKTIIDNIISEYKVCM